MRGASVGVMGCARHGARCCGCRRVWAVRCAGVFHCEGCGRDVLEGGGGGLKGRGGGWDIPPLRVPLWFPPKQNFGCQPQTLEGEEGGGGCTPPPPTVYGRSHTSLGCGRFERGVLHAIALQSHGLCTAIAPAPACNAPATLHSQRTLQPMHPIPCSTYAPRNLHSQCNRHSGQPTAPRPAQRNAPHTINNLMLHSQCTPHRAQPMLTAPCTAMQGP